jgi:Na+-transporting NADH:ubiquinone oxidoreductase subunit NqrF
LKMPSPRPKKKLRAKKKLREHYEEIMKHKKELLRELNGVWATICENKILEDVKLFDVASTVQMRIEHLMQLEALKKNEDNRKTTYKDIFSPIPHVSELPTDIYCRIQLKDTSGTITTRSYSSPRKYQEAWDKLIQKHLCYRNGGEVLHQDV